MAGARLLDVPGDEPRQARPRRTLRLDVQSQFRGPPGLQGPHASGLAGDGGGGGDRWALCRCEGLGRLRQDSRRRGEFRGLGAFFCEASACARGQRRGRWGEVIHSSVALPVLASGHSRSRVASAHDDGVAFNTRVLDLEDSGARIIHRRTPESAAMLANVKRAMAITAALNRLTFDDAEQVRVLFSKLTGREVDDSFLLIPPFYTAGGDEIRVGRNVFINQNCTFYDLGGLDIGDDVMIGPNVSLITAGHPLDPAQRR